MNAGESLLYKAPKEQAANCPFAVNLSGQWTAFGQYSGKLIYISTEGANLHVCEAESLRSVNRGRRQGILVVFLFICGAAIGLREDDSMNVFDIIGPVMVGPSSSHTAGAVRIGRIARELLGEQPVKISVLLYGSFARTYKGHGTDRALIAGLMGMHPHDERIPKSLHLAREANIAFSFDSTIDTPPHPNTALITVWADSGKCMVVQGSSTGGGDILITKINGMDVSFTGQCHTMIISHTDSPGAIAAVTNLLAHHGINIGNMKVYRSAKGGDAIMVIETDQEIDKALGNILENLPRVTNVVIIRPI